MGVALGEQEMVGSDDVGEKVEQLKEPVSDRGAVGVGGQT